MDERERVNRRVAAAMEGGSRFGLSLGLGIGYLVVWIGQAVGLPAWPLLVAAAWHAWRAYQTPDEVER